MRFSPYLNPPSFLLISVSLSRWFSLFSLEPPPPYVLHKFFNYTLQAPNFDPPMSTDPPKTLIASFFLWIHRFFNGVYSFYISFKNTLQAIFFDPRMSTDPPKIKKASFFLWIHRFFNSLYPFYMYWKILPKLYFLIHRCPPIHRKFLKLLFFCGSTDF